MILIFTSPKSCCSIFCFDIFFLFLFLLLCYMYIKITDFNDQFMFSPIILLKEVANVFGSLDSTNCNFIWVFLVKRL